MLEDERAERAAFRHSAQRRYDAVLSTPPDGQKDHVVEVVVARDHSKPGRDENRGATGEVPWPPDLRPQLEATDEPLEFLGVAASSPAEAAISSADAEVSCADAETCSVLSDDSSPTAATSTISCCGQTGVPGEVARGSDQVVERRRDVRASMGK